MSGRKSFTVRMKSNPAYTLIVDNFAKVSYWIATLRVNTVTFAISAVQTLKAFIISLRVNSVTFITQTNFFKTLLRIIMTLRVNAVTFSMTMKKLWEWVMTLKVNSMTFTTFVMSIRYRWLPNTIQVNTMLFTGSPTFGQFPFLSTYDPLYLSDMDDEFLSDLEFIET